MRSRTFAASTLGLRQRMLVESAAFTTGAISRRHVVAEIAIEAGIDREAADVRHEQRVSVRFRLGDDGERKAAAGSRAVIDDDLLAERVAQLAADRPRRRCRRRRRARTRPENAAACWEIPPAPRWQRRAASKPLPLNEYIREVLQAFARSSAVSHALLIASCESVPLTSYSIFRVTERMSPKLGRYTECVPGPPATTMPMSSGFVEIGSGVSGPMSPSSPRRE